MEIVCRCGHPAASHYPPCARGHLGCRACTCPVLSKEVSLDELRAMSEGIARQLGVEHFHMEAHPPVENLIPRAPGAPFECVGCAPRTSILCAICGVRQQGGTS